MSKMWFLNRYVSFSLHIHVRNQLHAEIRDIFSSLKQLYRWNCNFLTCKKTSMEFEMKDVWIPITIYHLYNNKHLHAIKIRFVSTATSSLIKVLLTLPVEWIAWFFFLVYSKNEFLYTYSNAQIMSIVLRMREFCMVFRRRSVFQYIVKINKNKQNKRGTHSHTDLEWERGR